MNYYERIQRSIEFIEDNLADDLDVHAAAAEACMSISCFYRMFLAITGCSVKEYIRLRRLSCAAQDLKRDHSQKIIDLAVKYGFSGSDSFSRAFRKVFGILPSEFRNRYDAADNLQLFRKADIMNTEFDRQDKASEERYPDVKVIKEMQQMRVACFSYFGEAPENHAFAEMKKWVREQGLSFCKGSDYRIFGYNNPDPQSPEETYGYEVCITIGDKIFNTLEDAPEPGRRETFDKVRRRVLPGGGYAVISIKRSKDGGDIGNEIMAGWGRFREWLEASCYVWDSRPYLEEHLGFDENDDHIGGVELYLPVRKLPGSRSVINTDMVPDTIEPCTVAAFRVSGQEEMDSISAKAWGKVISWACENGIRSEDHRIFEFNRGFDENAEPFQEIMVTVPDDFVTDDKEMVIKKFQGGRYMTVMTDLQNLLQSWGAMEQWRKKTHTKAGKHQWVEEWLIEDWKFPAKGIKIFYPLDASEMP